MLTVSHGGCYALNRMREAVGLHHFWPVRARRGRDGDSGSRIEKGSRRRERLREKRAIEREGSVRDDGARIKLSALIHL
jgi:hypothetical protein